jgi:hypothetical protein
VRLRKRIASVDDLSDEIVYQTIEEKHGGEYPAYVSAYEQFDWNFEMKYEEDHPFNGFSYSLLESIQVNSKEEAIKVAREFHDKYDPEYEGSWEYRLVVVLEKVEGSYMDV